MFIELALAALSATVAAYAEDGVVCQKYSSNSSSNESGCINSIDCFFPNNCESWNCVEGSEGDTCERCVSDYFRSGAVCLLCPAVPWSIFVGIVLLGIVAVVGSSNHFSVAVAVKVKMLVDMLQLLLLSLSFRVSWPQAIATVIDGSKIAFLNAEAFNVQCFTDTATAFYITWLSSISPLAVATVLIIIADRCMLKFKQRERGEVRQEMWMDRRSITRRFLLYICLISYAPVARLVIRPYACQINIVANIWYYNGSKPNTDSNKWAFDQSLDCSVDWFQGLTFISTIFLVCFTFLFPLLMLFFTIRIRKFKLHRQNNRLHGSVYEAYQPSWCFMEGIILLRKLILIILTDLYPIMPLVQILVSIFVSLLYFLLILFGTPFRKTYFRFCGTKLDVHNSFEALASFTVLVTQLSALLFLYNVITDAVQFVLLIINGTVIFLWLAIFFGQTYLEETWIEEIGDDQTDGESEAEQTDGQVSQPFFLKRKDGVTAAELRNREVAISEF